MNNKPKFNRKPSLPLIALFVLTALYACTSAEASVAYLRSETEAPWGSNSNETAMDTVFGTGNWSDLRYETLNPVNLFSAATTFVYMEGSSLNANELESFLNSNAALVQSWVGNGGNLFLNAAPNEGDGMSFGFGVTLNYGAAFSSTATAVDGAHSIFLGPYGATGTSFTGGWFSHATVSGALTPILTGSAGTILGEADYGSGHVLFGGMTTANFHSPQPASTILLANIVSYSSTSTAVAAVPETSTWVMGFLALGTIVFLVRRKNAIDLHTNTPAIDPAGRVFSPKAPTSFSRKQQIACKSRIVARRGS